MTIRFTQRIVFGAVLYLETLETMGKTSFLKDSFRWPRKLFAFFRFFSTKFNFHCTQKTTTMQCDLVGRLFTNTSASARVCVCVRVCVNI